MITSGHGRRFEHGAPSSPRARSHVAPALPRSSPTGYAMRVSQAWRQMLLLDVPMRSAITIPIELAASISDEDPRFEHRVIIVTDERGRFSYSIRLESTWRSRLGDEVPARASQTLESVARSMWVYKPVVDTGGTPIGLLGWDDVVRFALERGAGDPCWSAPPKAATRPGHGITPLANFRQRLLGRVRDVRDVAVAMLWMPPLLDDQNDGIQYLIEDGFVTPRDLFRAIFGELDRYEP